MAFVSTYKIKERNRIFISLILGIIYAISDEIHQAFIPRKGSYDNRCHTRCYGRTIGNINGFGNYKNVS